MKRLHLFSMLMCLSLCSMAQDGIYISFTTTVQDDQVLLTWAIVMGAECMDMEIQRSNDGVNFEPIHLYTGVCGSNTEDKEYEFADSFPLPLQANYYRLKSGVSDRSEILWVPYRFLPKGRNFSIFPHPVTESATFVFENPARKTYTFVLRDLKGREVFRQEDLRDREFELNMQTVEAGLYFFRLETEDQEPIVGRLVIQ